MRHFRRTAASMFDLAEKERLTIFGTVPKYLSEAKKQGVRPRESHDLSALARYSPPARHSRPAASTTSTATSKETFACRRFPAAPTLSHALCSATPLGRSMRGEIQTRGLGMKWRFSTTTAIAPTGPGVGLHRRSFDAARLLNDPDGEKYTRRISRTYRTSGVTVIGWSGHQPAA